MHITRETIIALLYGCLDELNEQLGHDHRLAKSPGTPLAGPAAGLDSLAFVNLVALVEDACQEQLGRPILLPDGHGDEETDPFASVATLAEHIEHAVQAVHVRA
jgi:hypothetical protein